jgi:hypothetical protein
MIARDPTLTAGKVLSTLRSTARAHPAASSCARAPVCGARLLDVGAALAVTPSPAERRAPGISTVVEYYRADVDRYFVTADTAEISALDGAPDGTWERTGQSFRAWTGANAPAGLQPVCRFYAAAATGIDSHWFALDGAECDSLRQRRTGAWELETPAAFYVRLPDDAGRCADGTAPVYRFANGKEATNQRFTADATVRRTMLNRSWIPEGKGERAVAFCVPL